ncbi:hypothetical protein BDZ91DRAFT_762601 [Kalaharituber pfeilii]|nr:hypothetical protein BDZ91DRAFT_762601 [Kalaharituber pfeilii]
MGQKLTQEIRDRYIVISSDFREYLFVIASSRELQCQDRTNIQAKNSILRVTSLTREKMVFSSSIVWGIRNDVPLTWRNACQVLPGIKLRMTTISTEDSIQFARAYIKVRLDIRLETEKYSHMCATLQHSLVTYLRDTNDAGTANGHLMEELIKREIEICLDFVFKHGIIKDRGATIVGGAELMKYMNIELEEL